MPDILPVLAGYYVENCQLRIARQGPFKSIQAAKHYLASLEDKTGYYITETKYLDGETAASWPEHFLKLDKETGQLVLIR